MTKTPAAWMAKFVTDMSNVALGIESKRESNPFKKPEIYGHFLVEQYCSQHKIGNFFASYSNLLSKLRFFVASHCDPLEQQSYVPLVKKYEAFINPKALGKPFDKFLLDHLDRRDVVLFTGLHTMMKSQAVMLVEIEQEDLEDAFDTIKGYADQIADKRFRDAVQIDLEKLKAIMENAKELGHYEFWDKYVQVSDLLSEILVASSGSVEETLAKRIGHYLMTAKYVRLVAMGIPSIIGVLADSVTIIDSVKKIS